MPELRPEFGEFVSAQWTRTRLCRLLRDYFDRTAERRAAGSEAGTGSPAGAGSGPGPGPIRVGTDVAFHYDASDRLARVVPDLFILEGIGYEEQLRSFRTWERGRAPQAVVHLVDAPVSPEDGLMMHFFRLGVKDVVLYDPLWALQPGSTPKGRRLLWHYQRAQRPPSAGPGPAEFMRLVPQEHPGRVHLSRYGLWLCHRGGADLRVYTAEAAPAEQNAPRPPVFPSEAALWPLPEERPPAR